MADPHAEPVIPPCELPSSSDPWPLVGVADQGEAAVLLGRCEERTRRACAALRARGLVATAPERVGGPTAGRARRAAR